MTDVYTEDSEQLRDVENPPIYITGEGVTEDSMKDSEFREAVYESLKKFKDENSESFIFHNDFENPNEIYNDIQTVQDKKEMESKKEKTESNWMSVFSKVAEKIKITYQTFQQILSLYQSMFYLELQVWLLDLQI
jgi:hypothetical protein